MDEFLKLGEFQYDVIREIGNIGAGHAATALSEILHTEVDMFVPSVQLISFDQIADVLGGSEQLVVGVFLRMSGDIPGNMFFLLQIESAKKLVRAFMNNAKIAPPEDQDDFSEMELSALSEVGNILAGSYLSSLAEFTKKRMTPSVPAIAIDMAGAILSAGLMQLGEAGEYALVVDTTFLQGKADIEGHFFLLPDPGAVSQLLAALGVDSI
ncbi:chemotaxis protein CheC [Fodinisporobacter ferrooxydans]|uniref:Chemotaxis protein CheC n=1 Tax=Fodinisporobacter ferrooxydans TaxID=2901836 RepID=A0ABY4CQW6_9BACL|nr:chemotaxis protein CheC [Alicyclobacillaceae bacterium MYW30-H2]